MKLTIFLTLILPAYVHAVRPTTFRWNLQITDPNFEVTNVQIDDKLHRPYLKKTSWRCWIGPTETKELPQTILKRKSLTCSYSIQKTGRITTFVSCSHQKLYDEGILELYDERKKMKFRLMLTCHQ